MGSGEVVMVEDAYRKDAGIIPRMRIPKWSLSKLSKVLRPLNLRTSKNCVISEDVLAAVLANKSELAQVSRGDISVVPTEVQGLITMSHRKILRYTHHGERVMSNDEFLYAPRKLVGMHGEFEMPVESRKVPRVGRTPRKKIAC